MHREELHALRETLQAEAADAAAVLTAERLRKLDEALSDRSMKLLQDNVRLKAELKVHTDVSTLLSIRSLCSCAASPPICFPFVRSYMNFEYTRTLLCDPYLPS